MRGWASMSLNTRTRNHNMAVTIQRSAFLEALAKHDPSSVAVIDSASGTSYSFGALLQAVVRARELLLLKAGRASHALSGERVAFMVENGIDYVGMTRHLQSAIQSQRAPHHPAQLLTLAKSNP